MNRILKSVYLIASLSSCEGRLKQSRALQTSSSPVTLISADETTVTVNIRQTAFGSTSKCTGRLDVSQTAAIYFWVYKDGLTQTPSCPLNKNVNACFETTQIIACDPVTHDATIDLYIKDETYTTMDLVINPKVGSCYGTKPKIGGTKKQTFTFECAAPVTGACESDTDCPAGSWCSPGAYYYDPMMCKPYATPGDSCGGLTAPGMESKCDPSSAYCDDLYWCTGLADYGGTCRAFGNVCQTDTDCQSTEYCDTSFGKCKQRYQSGECCGASKPCLLGLTCGQIEMDFGIAEICV